MDEGLIVGADAELSPRSIRTLDWVLDLAYKGGITSVDGDVSFDSTPISIYLR